MKKLSLPIAALGCLMATAAGAQTATGTYDGHTYAYYNSPLNFADANSFAAGLGGYLATITSQGEQDFVHTLTQGAQAYIGASDAATEGTWRWLGGPEAGLSFYSASGAPTDLSYSFWDGPEPNNLGGAENAALINWTGAGRWNDIGAGASYGYVVEFGGTTGAVPEPATWAMMMLGFGLMGAGLRRRQPALAASA